MAITVRYFSTSGAGAADGTTWNDRAALFTTGNWSSVITGFDFSGSDSLECRIGPGSYTCSQILASALFTNPPSAANLMLLHGCNSSGSRLTPADPDWMSAQPAWDASGLPDIVSSVQAVNLASVFLRLLKVTCSANAITINTCASVDFCHIVNSNSGSSGTGCISSVCGPILNSVIDCSACSSGWAYVVNRGTGSSITNSLLIGNSSASAQTRRGVQYSGATSPGFIVGCTISNCVGGGVVSSSTNVSQTMRLNRCTILNSGTGILGASTAAQTGVSLIDECYIANNGAYGINADASRFVASGCRLRDNTSGNFNGFGNYPTDMDNYTTDGDDTEFVNASAGDYRIRIGSAMWGKGYGAGDQILVPRIRASHQLIGG